MTSHVEETSKQIEALWKQVEDGTYQFDEEELLAAQQIIDQNPQADI